MAAYSPMPPSPRGDTDMPLSDAEISAKYHLFADPVLGRARADRVEELSGRFDTLEAKEFAELMGLVTSKASVA